MYIKRKQIYKANIGFLKLEAGEITKRNDKIAVNLNKYFVSAFLAN